jgi:hypothetical protein
MKISAKVSSKLLNLNEDYNSALVEIGINLVVKLAKELKSPSFIILMSLRVFQGEPKPQRGKMTQDCIFDSLNKFLEVLTHEIPNSLPPCKMVDLIGMVPSLTMLSKAPYRLNQKELKELKK